MRKMLYFVFIILLIAAALGGCFRSGNSGDDLNLEESLMQLENSGSFDVDFNIGYTDGYPDGYNGKKPKASINSGEKYLDGYALGYADGADSAMQGIEFEEGFGISFGSGPAAGDTIDITEGISIAANSGGSEVPVPSSFFEIETRVACGASSMVTGLGHFPGNSAPGCLWIWGPADNYDLVELYRICEQVDMKITGNRDFLSGGQHDNCGNWKNAKLYGIVLPPVSQRAHEAVGASVILEDINSHLPQYFNVMKYPTLIIFEPDGRVLGRFEGYSSPEKTYQQILAVVINEYKYK